MLKRYSSRWLRGSYSSQRQNVLQFNVHKESQIAYKMMGWSDLYVLSLTAIPIYVIELNVLILLRNDFSLNLPGRVSRTPNKNENRRASKPTECSQVSYLFNHSRTRGQYGQKGRTQDWYPAKDLYSIKNQCIIESCYIVFGLPNTCKTIQVWVQLREPRKF